MFYKTVSPIFTNQESLAKSIATYGNIVSLWNGESTKLHLTLSQCVPHNYYHPCIASIELENFLKNPENLDIKINEADFFMSGLTSLVLDEHDSSFMKTEIFHSQFMNEIKNKCFKNLKKDFYLIGLTDILHKEKQMFFSSNGLIHVYEKNNNFAIKPILIFDDFEGQKLFGLKAYIKRDNFADHYIDFKYVLTEFPDPHKNDIYIDTEINKNEIFRQKAISILRKDEEGSSLSGVFEDIINSNYLVSRCENLFASQLFGREIEKFVAKLTGRKIEVDLKKDLSNILGKFSDTILSPDQKSQIDLQ